MILALVLAAQLFMQQGSPIVSPIETHTTTQVNVTVQAPPPDTQAIADTSVQSSNDIMSLVIAPTLVDWDNKLMALPDLWRHTPDDLTWNNSGIGEMATTIRNVAMGLLAAAVFVYGLTLVLQQRVEGAGRLVFGVILSVGDLVWWQIGIRLNNAINDAIGAPDLPSLIKPHVGLNVNPGQQAANVALVIVYAGVALLVLLSLLSRLGLIQILIAIGPLALFCMATEQSEHFAHKYIALSVGLLFSQVMIVIGMKVAQVDAAVGTGIAGTFMALIVLLLIRKLPGLVSSSASGGNGAGRAVRTAVTVARRAAGSL